MAEHYIDTEKFYIRAIQEADMEQVTEVINNTKFSKLFRNSGDIELQDTIMRKVYLEAQTSYCIFDKGDRFMGYISISPEGDEGEVSVRLADMTDIEMIMEIMVAVYKKLGIKAAQNFTVNYEFD